MDLVTISRLSSEGSGRQDTLRESARAVEAAFLSEMLKAAGVAETRSVLGGGAGEDQFVSLLRAALADEVVANGGIGLADTIYRQLRARDDD